MNTYKVGDTVKIRKDLKVGKMYGEECFYKEMKKHLGKTAKIIHIGLFFDYYILDIDDEDWSWSSKMFEPVTRNLYSLKQGDIIENEDGKRKILGVCGEVIFLSKVNDFRSSFFFHFTPYDLEAYDYKLFSPQEETITILGKTYLKSDVEEKLKELEKQI
jgi:hypothetical protein